MARAIWLPGGGGANLDVITAEAGDIVKGMVAVDKEGEPVTGTLELTGNAQDGNVLSGKTYYNTDTKTKRTGAMTERGAVSQALNCGGSYTIPEGHHNGSGKITANSLSSQTSATATAATILAGYTAWVNGSKLTGTVAVQSILSFSAAPYSSTQITFTWKNPAKGAFSGVIIVGKTGSYPTSISDGTRWYKGSGNNTAASGTSAATVSGFTGGTTYYFRCFSYAIKNNAEWVHGTTYTATAATTKGTDTITESETWTVPANVRSIDIFLVGGGASPMTSANEKRNPGGGGGYTKTYKGISVTPGQQFTVTIGAGGASGYASGNAGNVTTFGSYSAEGGKPGTAVTFASGSVNYYKGGDGGSGGGSINGTGGTNGGDGTAYHVHGPKMETTIRRRI